MEEYYQAAMLDPGDEALVLEVSRRLLQDKQPERALEIVKRAAARPDASGEIYARLGLIYSQLGKPDQAAAANRDGHQEIAGFADRLPESVPRLHAQQAAAGGPQRAG